MRLKDIIIPIIFSLGVGSVIGSYFRTPLVLVIIFFSLSIIFLLVGIKNKYVNITTLSFCLIFLTTGIVRGIYHADLMSLPLSLERVVGEYTNIEGEIIDNPVVKNDKQSFLIISDGVKIKAYAPKYPILSYGDRINIFGRVKKPENFFAKNGKEVEYESLLRARGIHLILEGKRFEIISQKNRNTVLLNIYKLKNKIAENLNIIGMPESGLLFSMVFGGKNYLTDEMLNDFRIAGLLHIVVLSGQNLTIVAMIAVIFFTGMFGFKTGHILTLLMIFVYGIMGGFEPATTRAVYMTATLITLLLFGKVSSAGRVLFVSALAMIIINPYLLFDDPSFQLSVLAFLGIIYLSPIIDIWLIKKWINPKVSSYFSAILGAQLSVLPFIIYMSQTITPYSLFSNALALFMVGFVTVYGMIISIISIASLELFEIISFPIKYALGYIIKISDYISSLPFSEIDINMNILVTIFLYVLLIIFVIKAWRRDEMSPLGMFIIKDETEKLKRGVIPYVEE